jgi:hypothetical protein
MILLYDNGFESFDNTAAEFQYFKLSLVKQMGSQVFSMHLVFKLLVACCVVSIYIMIAMFYSCWL